ncbi:MAG: cupin domain-containing protein [Anaerolineae bacterium]|nr:cupin domain-containing protein [Anaerolineae bacterium]
MNDELSDVVVEWLPEPIPAEKFHKSDGCPHPQWANINRAPYDQVSGVIYKRAMNIKLVQYAPAEPAPEMPEPWQGHGPTVVRWLFSEQPGTEEKLLAGATFEFLHDTSLAPGAATGQRAHPGVDEIVYVIAGQGMLYHCPTDGSPVLARPLRPGDAALIRGEELHSVANVMETGELRLLVLGVRAK